MTKNSDKYKTLFDTTHVKKDLKGRSVRGGAFAMAGQISSYVIRLSSTVILARLLTPDDYGLIAMVMVLTNFALMFKDMGLTMATVQREEINHQQISTLFWINVAICTVIALILMVSSPLIAWFYDDDRLINITLALSTIFIISGFAIQHQAIMRRQMRFGALAAILFCSIVFGVIVAIVAAWKGMGYWSLILLQIASSVFSALVIWIVCPWRPGWPVYKSGVYSMLAFGRNITGFNMINYFARNSDKILIGRFYGSGVLGLYSKAYSLLMLPINQICGPLTSVAVPALSRLQDDPKRYASYYSTLILLISFISMPLIMFLAFCSKSIIHLLLGEQWLGMSRIFQILAITAFIQPVSTTVGLILISMNQSIRFLKYGIFNSLVIVTAFAIGINWGAIGVASAYAGANYLILFPVLWYCFRLTPISITIFVKAIARPTMASLCMALTMLLARPFLTGQLDIVAVCTNFGIAYATYFIVWVLMPGGINTLREFKQYTQIIFTKAQ